MSFWACYYEPMPVSTLNFLSGKRIAYLLDCCEKWDITVETRDTVVPATVFEFSDT